MSEFLAQNKIRLFFRLMALKLDPSTRPPTPTCLQEARADRAAAAAAKLLLRLNLKMLCLGLSVSSLFSFLVDKMNFMYFFPAECDFVRLDLTVKKCKNMRLKTQEFFVAI